MLFLLFELGRERYALEARHIVEVLPLVRVKPLIHAPRGVAGVFSYRGAPVPVVDLSEIALDRPTPSQRTTRIVLVKVPDDRGATRLVGLVAEHATDTLRRDAADFQSSGVGRDDAACAGRVTSDARGVIQWLDLAMLLPASLREALFAESEVPDGAR
jgi:chemotaxis-related protein WspB